ncbi:MAG: hypothetical protein II844_01770 [Prevotella sp.]|nr:hypothetical protein [Prevotella sp.]MBR6192420.1 hypothetical protein [Prevotella sp.]
MKKEYKYPSIEVLELGSMSQLMAGTITEAESDAGIDPVVSGGHEQPRAKEAGGWDDSMGW